MTLTSKPEAGTHSFGLWRGQESLSQCLARLEAKVRSQPADIGERWALFELMCVLRQWDRAIKALQFCVMRQSDLLQTAYVMRALIKADQEREAVFNGKVQPLPVGELTPALQGMAQALSLNASGEHDKADQVRSKALELFESQPMSSNLGNASWLSDSDTRLAGVFECVLAGTYRWLPFSDLVHVEPAKPRRLLDLIWLPLTLVLRDGASEWSGPVEGYLPLRYPLSGSQPGAQPLESDALLLARETRWSSLGETGVVAQGQKTLMNDLGDWAFLDLQYLALPGHGSAESESGRVLQSGEPVSTDPQGVSSGEGL